MGIFSKMIYQVGVQLTVPQTVNSGVWAKLVKLPQIPPSMYIRKNGIWPYALHTRGPNISNTQQPRATCKKPECCRSQVTETVEISWVWVGCALIGLPKWQRIASVKNWDEKAVISYFIVMRNLSIICPP
jgi:hypothetical protein